MSRILRIKEVAEGAVYTLLSKYNSTDQRMGSETVTGQEPDKNFQSKSAEMLKAAL
ncbi:hypothetical protein J7K42_00420 [bacterium]|nr:hypothetical protein [bacterium]